MGPTRQPLQKLHLTNGPGDMRGACPLNFTKIMLLRKIIEKKRHITYSSYKYIFTVVHMVLTQRTISKLCSHAKLRTTQILQVIEHSKLISSATSFKPYLGNIDLLPHKFTIHLVPCGACWHENIPRHHHHICTLGRSVELVLAGGGVEHR